MFVAFLGTFLSTSTFFTDISFIRPSLTFVDKILLSVFFSFNSKISFVIWPILFLIIYLFHFIREH